MPASEPDFKIFPIVGGIRLAAAGAGIKNPDRDDLALIEIVAGSTTAAVFTRNAFCAAPVIVAKEHLAETQPRYLLINSGNANAGTGATGLAAARRSCTEFAKLAGCDENAVLPFSTGVIGEDLPVEKMVAELSQLNDKLQPDNWQQVAAAICTTDTVSKAAWQNVAINGRAVTVAGIAKGAGMIRPDMATMLAFVATDARVEPSLLQACLQSAVNDSFNRITVDGDTSTNDACVLMASGASGVEVTDGSAALESFTEVVTAVCTSLAEQIIADGEGATRLVRIVVSGGRESDECRQVAYAVAHSPLVKTAFFAGDPNWGRILAAVGRAGVHDLDIDGVRIHLEDVCIVEHGGRAASYTEAQGQQVMAQDEISVRIELGRGTATAEVITCDLSYDYVRINAEYRT